MTNYQRIVSLAPSTTEILFALGCEKEVVGVTSFCDYPPQVRTKARIKGFSTPDPERILALQPDLVLATRITPPPVIDVLRRQEIDVVALPDPSTVAEVLENITTVGRVVGCPVEAERVVATLRTNLERITTRIRTIPSEKRPRVLLTFGGVEDPLWVVGTGNFLDDLIHLSGGINAAEGIGRAWAEIPLRDLAEFDPEVIISDYRRRDDPTGLLGAALLLLTENERTRELPAVRSGWVYLFPADLLKRPGPRIVEGLELLAQTLHPQLFPQNIRRSMRICSLLPSSTEIAFALGLGDQVVAVTHECDYPPQVRTKRIITRSALAEHDHTSREIDHLVSAHAGHEHSLYHLDETVLQELNPDLILTQELCTVCAVSYREVQEAARILEGKCRIVSLEPTSLEDILDNIRLVGRLTGREAEAHDLVADLQARIDRVRLLSTGVGVRPSVFCLEWLDPPWAARHWVPQMVWIAGGEDRLGRWKAPSVRTTWEVVARYNPEVIVMMPCGFDVERTLRELGRTEPPLIWRDLPAVRAGRVFVVNGSAYFNRPGPRIVDGLEILAGILHPEIFGGIFPEGVVHRLEEGWG